MEFKGLKLKKMYFPIVMKSKIKGHPTARIPLSRKDHWLYSYFGVDQKCMRNFLPVSYTDYFILTIKT